MVKKIVLFSITMVFLLGCSALNREGQFFSSDVTGSDFKSVIVEIQSPIFVLQNGKSVSVPLPNNLPVEVDLLGLNEVNNVLSATALPEGTITKIWIALSNPQVVLEDDTVLDNNKINFKPLLEIVPSTPITVSAHRNSAVGLLGLNVQTLVRIDWVGDEKPVFSPLAEIVNMGVGEGSTEAIASEFSL